MNTENKSVNFISYNKLLYLKCGLWSVTLVNSGSHPYLVWPHLLESYGQN